MNFAQASETAILRGGGGGLVETCREKMRVIEERGGSVCACAVRSDGHVEFGSSGGVV